MATKTRSLNNSVELEAKVCFREPHELFADGQAGYKRFQEEMQEVHSDFLRRQYLSEQLAGEIILA